VGWEAYTGCWPSEIVGQCRTSKGPQTAISENKDKFPFDTGSYFGQYPRGREWTSCYVWPVREKDVRGR
jgi:hypothetical protein